MSCLANVSTSHNLNTRGHTEDNLNQVCVKKFQFLVFSFVLLVLTFCPLNEMLSNICIAEMAVETCSS